MILVSVINFELLLAAAITILIAGKTVGFVAFIDGNINPFSGLISIFLDANIFGKILLVIILAPILILFAIGYFTIYGLLFLMFYKR
jgi:hypothetical protein